MAPCARGNKIVRMDKLTGCVTADDCNRPSLENLGSYIVVTLCLILLKGPRTDAI